MDEQLTRRFRADAHAFCILVEDDRFVADQLLAALLGLVSLGLQLPNVDAEPDTASDNEQEDPSWLADRSARVEDNVRRVFGETVDYWEVFDPRVLSEPVLASLWDDVGDTYRDLQRGSHLAETHSLVEAAWFWRFSMESHWGDHATDAIRVLFRLVSEQRFKHLLNEDDPSA